MQNVIIKEFEKLNPGHQGCVRYVSVRGPVEQSSSRPRRPAIHRTCCDPTSRGSRSWPRRAWHRQRRKVEGVRGDQEGITLRDHWRRRKSGASYYAFPDDTNTQALYWNKADFAAAGISGPPTTINQLLADAATLTVPAKRQYGLGVDGTDIWNIAPYVWSMGGSFTNSKYTQATGYMDSTATITAVHDTRQSLEGGRHRQ